jgi:uncharacterized integral membrane protein
MTKLLRLVRLVVWLVILLLVVLFVIANRQTVSVSFSPFSWEITSPLFVIVLLSGLVGFLIGSVNARLDHLFDGFSQYRRKREVEALKAENKALQSEKRRGSTNLSHKS